MAERRQKHSLLAAEEAAVASLELTPSSLGGLNVSLPCLRFRQQQNQSRAPAIKPHS